MAEAAAFPLRRLEDVVDLLDHLRVPVNGTERSGRNGAIPYYGANGLQGWIDRPIFDEPLILLAEDGGNFEDFASRPIAYRIDGPSWVNNHAHVIRAKEGVAQSFVFWSLVNKDIRKYIAGGTRTKLTQAELRQIEIHVPSSESERRAVGKILDTLDTAIRRTEAIIAKLKQVKQGLLHDLLTRGIDANGELRPSQSPHLYKPSPLGWIPKEWDTRTLGDISSNITSGSRDWASFYAESGALFVRIGNLTREHINLRLESLIHVRPPAYGDGQRTRLEVDDLLVSITADLGIIGVVPAKFGEAYINQHIALVQLKPDLVNARFVGHYLAADVAQTHIRKLNDAGAKAGLNLPTISNLVTVIPEHTEQDNIARRLDEADSRVACVKSELAKLGKLKSGLMEDLLTGRVRVTPLLEATGAP